MTKKHTPPVKMCSSCFPLSALKLTSQLFVESMERYAILMTPSVGTLPDLLPISQQFFFSSTCLVCDQYAVSLK